ncbi:hypothetical protein M9Y10_016534 [Tritrichomonas musculus]|uniref:Uncharacterized protein n=1 Tax=Tritrichomonas musculus TaxID=1915356 RepID=A0ABR2HWK4_9EUKA
MKSALDVSQRLEYDAQVYGEYSQSIAKFSQAIWTLISTEVEEGSSLFSPLCQILDDISGRNMSISKEIIRAVEDLRDIFERNVVIQRKEAEHALLIKQYEDAKLRVSEAKTNFKLSESRPDYYMIRDSLENSIKELENEQKEATRKLRDETLSLIEHKKRYQRFQMRRTKSCFERIGNAFKKSSEESIILLSRFIQGLRQIKNGDPLSNFVLYGQDSAPEEFSQGNKANDDSSAKDTKKANQEKISLVDNLNSYINDACKQEEENNDTNQKNQKSDNLNEDDDTIKQDSNLNEGSQNLDENQN